MSSLELNNYTRVSSLDEAYELLLENEKNIIVGGGAWLKLTNKKVDNLIDISTIGLNEIIEKDDSIEIGAMTSLRQIETSDIVSKQLDGIVSKAARSIMGVNIRNIATIGGSIMGKYSFSDLLTPLVVMNTTLVFYKKGEVALEEFMNTKKFPKDILVKVIIEKQKGKGFFYNMKKTALDFAVINVAVTKTDTVKIAIGARPGLTKLPTETLKKINETTKINEEMIKNFAKEVRNEISVSSNSRAGKEYREELVEVYVRRGLMEVFGNES